MSSSFSFHPLLPLPRTAGSAPRHRKVSAGPGRGEAGGCPGLPGAGEPGLGETLRQRAAEPASRLTPLSFYFISPPSSSSQCELERNCHTLCFDLFVCLFFFKPTSLVEIVYSSFDIVPYGASPISEAV